MNPVEIIQPDWKWGTAEGSRELDRLLDSRLTFLEKRQWLEEAETLSLQLRARHDAAEEKRKPETSKAERGLISLIENPDHG
jgi:hypothetical protein